MRGLLTDVSSLFLSFVLAHVLLVAPARADVIDTGSTPVPVLADLVEPLAEAGIDVLYDHASEPGAAGPSFGDRPRVAPLLGIDSWPGVGVDLEHYRKWLDDFASGARGAVAAVPSDEPKPAVSWESFEKLWDDAASRERVFVTFAANDLAVAERVAGALVANGYAVYLAVADPEREVMAPDSLGRMFGEADHHLVIDTTSGRMNPVIRFEAELLAELRRQKEWLASKDAGLPPVKRGSMDVVEALGMLPMKILPGGIVLGTTPKIDDALAGATLLIDGSDYGVAADGNRFVMEQVSVETRETILEFIAIADSHSVVDIAGGSITLAAPFEGTRIGKRMTKADRRPFERLSVKGAKKSLIVDEAVRLRRVDETRAAIDVTLEVRFYRTDDEGHADRLATLRFSVEDATGSKRLLDLSWSRRPGSRIGFDGAAVDGLIDDLEQLALDAALIAVARLGPKG